MEPYQLHIMREISAGAQIRSVFLAAGDIIGTLGVGSSNPLIFIAAVDRYWDLWGWKFEHTSVYLGTEGICQYLKG